jgi:hypothetical protein
MFLNQLLTLEGLSYLPLLMLKHSSKNKTASSAAPLTDDLRRTAVAKAVTAAAAAAVETVSKLIH